MNREEISYPGSELAAMAAATNYYAWLARRFEPFLGPVVIEVGAGIGTFSSVLLSLPKISNLIAIEPASNTYPALARAVEGDPRATAMRGYLEDYTAESSADSLVAVNVLEHVEDDARLLRKAREIVRPGGTLLLFVPAIPALYGTLDAAFEHFRRYTRTVLRNRIEDAGWEMERINYMNLPGVLSWFVAGRIMRKESITRSEVRLYDRAVVPLASIIEDRIKVPIGQSLLAIARNPG